MLNRDTHYKITADHLISAGIWDALDYVAADSEWYRDGRRAYFRDQMATFIAEPLGKKMLRGAETVVLASKPAETSASSVAFIYGAISAYNAIGDTDAKLLEKINKNFRITKNEEPYDRLKLKQPEIDALHAHKMIDEFSAANSAVGIEGLLDDIAEDLFAIESSRPLYSTGAGWMVHRALTIDSTRHH